MAVRSVHIVNGEHVNNKEISRITPSVVSLFSFFLLLLRQVTDRDAIIIKLKELQNEKNDLKRRNRLLEIWVFRNLKKVSGFSLSCINNFSYNFHASFSREKKKSNRDRVHHRVVVPQAVIVR